jgi:hypothetical protein
MRIDLVLAREPVLGYQVLLLTVGTEALVALLPILFP